MPPLLNRLVNRFVRALARTPAHRFLGRHLVVLRCTGRRSGRCYELPVMSAQTGEDPVEVSGQHDRKTWWRNVAAAVSPSGVERVTARPDGAVGLREHDQLVLIEILVGVEIDDREAGVDDLRPGRAVLAA